MVSVKMVGRFTGPPNPCEVGEDRKIPNGPLFTKDEIEAALDNGQIKPVTQDCINDLQALGLDLEDLKVIVGEAINSGKYKDSEWALLNRERGVWTACDAYVLKRDEWVDKANKSMSIEYYLKFSLSNEGEMILTVSFHT